MHRPVCITYDSTCDLTPQLLERFRIRTVPLTIQSGERVFPDDGRYTSADLYADYRSRGTLPKTAAVSPEEFKSFFAPILAEGYDIVHIDISAELSCTCQNAVLAAQELTERDYEWLEEKLAEEGFLRIHNSFLVNMSYIAALQTSGVTLTTGQVLPVSLHGYKAIKMKYMAWRGRG